MAINDPEDTDEIFGELERRFGRRIQEAFNQSVEELRDQFTIEEIAQRLDEQGINGAVQLLAGTAAGAAQTGAAAEGVQIQAIFERVGSEKQQAMMAAGRKRAEEISGNVEGPQGTVRFTFDPGHPDTAERLREGKRDLIREITDEQEQVVRNAVADSLGRGENPRDAARAFKDSIGLTQKQERAVQNFRRNLQARQSGAPSAEALDRELRDKRFDRSIRNAIANDEPLTEQQIDRMTERYRAKMVKHRSEVIARTESLRGLSEGREAARDQAIDEGKIKPEQVRRFWITARDERVRENHRRIPTMNSSGVGPDEPFDAPLGPLRYPRDPRGSASQTVQCRCAVSERIVDAEDT